MSGVLTPQELQSWLQAGRPVLLVDVREASEWQLVRLPQAQWRPLSALHSWIEDIAAETAAPVVVYCHHGVRSARVCGLLQAQGAREVFNLEGGIERWAREVEPGMKRY